MQLVLKFLLARTQEPSTWGGLALMNQAFGWYPMTAEQMYALGTFGMALMAAPDDSIDKLKARLSQMRK